MAEAESWGNGDEVADVFGHLSFAILEPKRQYAANVAPDEDDYDDRHG